MNKVIFMGRLTRDPEVRYGGANNTAVAHFSIAVNRRYKRDGESDADFFRCVSLGKQGEFAEKYLKKGTKILLEGEIRNNNYTNSEGQMVYGTEILVNSVEFAESRRAQQEAPSMPQGDGFMNIPDGLEEEMPFS